MSLYVPVVLFFTYIGDFTQQRVLSQNVEEDFKMLTPSQKRKRALARRKLNKHLSRKEARQVRLWREWKRILSEKYGMLIALLFEPLFIRLVLSIHASLTWWIQAILEERLLRFIKKEMMLQNQDMKEICVRTATLKPKISCRSLDYRRACERKRWRILMDPQYKRRTERSTRRCKARHLKAWLSVCDI